MMIHIRNTAIKTLYTLYCILSIPVDKVLLTFHPGLIKGEPRHKEGGLEHIECYDTNSTVDAERL